MLDRLLDLFILEHCYLLLVLLPLYHGRELELVLTHLLQHSDVVHQPIADLLEAKVSCVNFRQTARQLLQVLCD